MGRVVAVVVTEFVGWLVAVVVTRLVAVVVTQLVTQLVAVVVAQLVAVAGRPQWPQRAFLGAHTPGMPKPLCALGLVG